MNKSRVLLILLVLIGIGWVAFAPEAYAQSSQVQVAQAKPGYCDSYAGLTNKIASCIRKTVDTAAKSFFTGFYPLVQRAIGGVMTLAIIVYGIMLSYGMVEKLGRDTMLLAIKLAAVVAFTAQSPMIYQMVTKMMDGATIAAITYTPPSGPADAAGSDFSQAKCMQLMKSQQEKSNATNAGTGQKQVVGPWLAMDCLLDTVIGIKVISATADDNTLIGYNKALDGVDKATAQGSLEAAKSNNVGMSRGLLYVFASGLQTSTVGLVMGIIGFAFVWGLLVMIVKALFTYLAGYIGIALMIIVSPLFIPLLLFRETKVYFDKWVKTTISVALQPVIMMTFVTFSLAAVDFAAFSGKYSVYYRIAGEAATKDKFDLNKYLSDPRKADGTVDTATPPDDKSSAIISSKQRPIFSVKATGPTPIANSSSDLGGVVAGMKYSDCTSTLINLDKSGTLKEVCNFKYDVGTWTSYLDWELMAKARKPEVTKTDDANSIGQQIAREVLSSLLFCAIVVFIMNGMMSMLPFMVTDLAGDAGQSSNLMKAVGGQFTGGQQAMGNISDKLANLKNKVAGKT